MKTTTFTIIALIVVLLMIVGIAAATSFNDTEYTVTITDKERVVESDSSYYLIFTEDQNGEVLVFENADNIFRGKFDSSNIQGELKIGCTYNITVVGYRIPFLSMYQNIIEIEHIRTDAK